MIPFIQYLLPNGLREYVEVNRSEDVETKAGQIIAAGFRFEVEILKTGAVSVTITNDEEGDVAIEVIDTDGPEVLEAVDRMIMKWRPQ